MQHTYSDNPFQAIYEDPTGNRTLIAAMDDELLMINLKHFVLDKPQFDMNEQKNAMLADYADIGSTLTEKTAMSLGLKLPSPAEIAAAEEAMKEITSIIHRNAIAKAYPFMIIALLRPSTCEAAREMIFELVGDQFGAQIEYQVFRPNVVNLLPAPRIDGDEEEYDDEL